MTDFAYSFWYMIGTNISQPMGKTSVLNPYKNRMITIGWMKFELLHLG